MRTNFRLILYYSILFLFIFSGCGSTSVSKKIFSDFDLAGSWDFIHFGRMSEQFGSYGSLDINSFGFVTNGIVNNFGVDIQKFTNGKFNISNNGVVTGSIDAFLADSNTYEKLIIYKGNMIGDKDLIIYSASFDLGRKGIGVLLKKKESFFMNDLNGEWILPLDGIFTVSINNVPEIISCSYITPSGDTLNCFGSISLGSDGYISGNLQFENYKPFKTDFNGHINSGKDALIIAGGISTRFEGISALMLKKTKEFPQDILKGNWNIYIPTAGDTCYGTLQINESGLVLKGEWTDSKNGSGFFTGEIKITDKEHGNIAGFISVSELISYTIIGGGINSSGDIISLSAKDKSGIPIILLMVKT